jgi:hypothetical protein
MRVFICSTCYDLIDLRAELKEFFREAGVEPVLSDSLDSEFQVNPESNSIETCLANVRNCDAFVIILSNRYGPSLKSAGFDDVSATHLEYLEAVKYKKPIFMYVRDRLEADYSIWHKNKNTPNLKLLWCKESQDQRIFEVLKSHRELSNTKPKNNWFWMFKDSVELKQRLAKDFKEPFARAMVERLFSEGRIPCFEITGQVKDCIKSKVTFDLHIRNVSNTYAISPQLKISGTVNKWQLAGLASRESTDLHISWNTTGGYFLPLRYTLNYSILEGHQFYDEGELMIPCNPRDAYDQPISSKVTKRDYLKTIPEMLLFKGI